MAEKIERRPAAILSTDVICYTRLMGADEKGALGPLQAHRFELDDPGTAELYGRIVAAERLRDAPGSGSGEIADVLGRCAEKIPYRGRCYVT